MRRWLYLFACAAGCGTPATVVIDGRVVERPTFELQGDAYHVVHRRAHPRPTKGLEAPGGDIVGRVCGMDVDVDVRHAGDHLVLLGFIDGHISTRLELRDRQGVREISGNIGPLGVDLALATNELKGHVGLRVLAVGQSGDSLRGFIRTGGIIDRTTGKPSAGSITIAGRDALWSMPAADQALLVPTILTCAWLLGEAGFVGPLSLRFGGDVVDRPPESSALYHMTR